MRYKGYLITLDGQGIKKISFGNDHSSAAEAGKLHEQIVCPRPLGTPPPPPTHTPKKAEKHMKRGQNMLYIGYLIILDGQSIKKSVSESSIFEVPRPENCINRLCALDPLAIPPLPTHTPKSGEKHTKRVQNMLYIAYFITVSGQNIKKKCCKKFSIFDL